MIPQLISGWYTTPYMLGYQRSIPLFVVSVLVLVVCLSPEGVKGGKTRGGDWAVGIITSIISLSAAAVFFYRSLVYRLEDNFDIMPWCTYNQSAELPVGDWKCPFTGLKPNRRCPCCHCHCHDTVFHEDEKRVKMPGGGETVLNWERAAEAVESDDPDVMRQRALLDETLDFRGNFMTGDITACCIACDVWMKSFQLYPRWVLTTLCISLTSVWSPWAFQLSLAQTPGNSGDYVQCMMLTLGIYFAMACFLVEMMAVCRTIAFMSKYRKMFKFPSPLVVTPDQRWYYKLVVYFSDGAWEEAKA